ncbi:hypothetical protein ACODT3_11040 [Streptomyces sp. 4.24]|uniref:hypothetical protein n=1 Tax=Streptomyces tritrimontium TaxID=3406573 RepID=UPI003BB53483
MRRAVTVVAVLLGLLVAAGCGEAGPRRAAAAPELRPRMEEVARAWEGSAELKEWRAGFHLLEDPVRLPADAFRDGRDKAAYAERNFALRGELPVGGGGSARIRWSDGAALDVTALGASAAYGALTGGAPTREHPLTVTGARFGELTVKTSRGPALVPVWFFDLEGYGEPLARVALARAESAEPPVEPMQPSGSTTVLTGHGAADPGATAFTVDAGHGACDGGVAVEVLEGADTVVLGGRILPGRELPEGEGCPAVMLGATVPVTLSRPLGGRVLVDAVSGEALGHSGGAVR